MQRNIYSAFSFFQANHVKLYSLLPKSRYFDFLKYQTSDRPLITQTLLFFLDDGNTIWTNEYKCSFVDKTNPGNAKCNLTFKTRNQLVEHRKQSGHLARKRKSTTAADSAAQLKQLRIERNPGSSTSDKHDDHDSARSSGEEDDICQICECDKDYNYDTEKISQSKVALNCPVKKAQHN